MNVTQIKKGAILAYVLIVVNTLYGLLFTPFLISKLGMSQYGVFKIISSLSASITVFDLGVGTTTLRYISKFRAEKDYKQINNFYAMSMVESAILSAIISVVCVGIYFSLDSLYGESLTAMELIKAKQLFILFTITLVLNIFEKVIFNVVLACEKFVLANSLKLLRILAKIGLAVIILSYIADSVMLLFIDIALLLVIMAIQTVYLFKTEKIKIKLYKWDNRLFKESFAYTVLTFVQSIVVQFNGNLDNMVIGAVLNASTVAIYSIGLQLYSMYDQFACSISNLMLPTVSKQIAEKASNRDLEDTVIKAGRFQFAALGAALCGYTIIGKEFIYLWLGKEYEFAWIVGMILMVPATIPLMQNVCLSILRAKNKMQFRTVAVCVMAVFNLIITVFGVKKYGAIAACVGTAAGLIGANVIAMNVYYQKVIGLNVFRIFKNILSRIWICCLLASLALVLISFVLTGNTWIVWILKAGTFALVYGVLLLVYGLSKAEKKTLLKR